MIGIKKEIRLLKRMLREHRLNKIEAKFENLTNQDVEALKEAFASVQVDGKWVTIIKKRRS